MAIPLTLILMFFVKFNIMAINNIDKEPYTKKYDILKNNSTITPSTLQIERSFVDYIQRKRTGTENFNKFYQSLEKTKKHLEQAPIKKQDYYILIKQNHDKEPNIFVKAWNVVKNTFQLKQDTNNKYDPMNKDYLNSQIT